jgi:hypothetical protein
VAAAGYCGDKPHTGAVVPIVPAARAICRTVGAVTDKRTRRDSIRLRSRARANHLQFTKALDHLRLRNLAGQIVPVTAMGIDFGRLHEARLVIVPQRLDREQLAREKSPIVSMAGVAAMASVCTLPSQESQSSKKKGLSLPLLEAGE